LVTFNSNFRVHIACILSQRGFAGWCKTQIDEKTVERLMAHSSEVRSLVEFLMVEKGLSHLIAGDSSLIRTVGEDDRINGITNPLGTITGRGAYFQSRLIWTPCVSKPYGHRFGDCFKTPPGWVFVSADTEGL
jgi:hypothetical protein